MPSYVNHPRVNDPTESFGSFGTSKLIELIWGLVKWDTTYSYREPNIGRQTTGYAPEILFANGIQPDQQHV